MLEEPGLVLPLERPARIVLWRRLDLVLTETNVDLRVRPAHRRDPLGRKHYLPAGPPVARIHDQVADSPRAVVDQEVLHVTDVAVERGDVVAGHVVRAPEVGISFGGLAVAGGQLLQDRRDRGPDRNRRHPRIGQQAPAIRAFPVVLLVVVTRERFLLLTVHRLIGVDRRAMVYLLPAYGLRHAV